MIPLRPEWPGRGPDLVVHACQQELADAIGSVRVVSPIAGISPELITESHQC
jgi:hypothetical protein